MYSQEKIKPYSAQGSKTRQVETMFNSIAHSYDRLNHLMSLGIDKSWRIRTLKALLPYKPQHILDIATGTGDFALMAHRILAPQSIVACDISEGMMAIGRDKVLKAGLQEVIAFRKEDCEHLSFPDNSFDTVTVAYGVRNFEHLDAGLQEMRRVLQDGGHLAILELCTPQHFPMRQLFWIYSHLWMPTVGRILSKDNCAYTYLPRTMEAFPQGEIMQDIIKKAGFKEVVFKRFTFGLSTMYLAKK